MAGSNQSKRGGSRPGAGRPKGAKDKARRSHTLNCAIYLFGHGPQREPRLIELQHRTILRAIPWLEQHWQARLVIGEVFVDLNFSPGQPHKNLAALNRLLREINSKKYSHVLLNILSGSFPTEKYNWIEQEIEAAGADVWNLAYEQGPFIEHLVGIYGERCRDTAARAQGYDDSAELLALFPALCASIVDELLAGNRLTDTSHIEHLELIIRQLASERPYNGLRVPWPHWGSARQLHAAMHREQEEDKSRRMGIRDTVDRL